MKYPNKYSQSTRNQESTVRPRTKHLAVQLHHFRQYILNKQIAVEKVDTKYQRADIMTKALPKDSFQFLRKTITGW